MIDQLEIRSLYMCVYVCVCVCVCVCVLRVRRFPVQKQELFHRTSESFLTWYVSVVRLLTRVYASETTARKTDI